MAVLLSFVVVAGCRRGDGAGAGTDPVGSGETRAPDASGPGVPEATAGNGAGVSPGEDDGAAALAASVGSADGAAAPAEAAAEPPVVDGPSGLPGDDGILRGDGYEGVILSDDPLPDSAGEPWAPSPDDVATAERLVRDQLAGMSASPEYQQAVIGEIVAHLPEYRRQYVARRDAGGHRVLWIGFFRSGGFPDWTERLVSVRGGGHDYFNLEVDLDAGKCRALRINSPR